MRKALHYIPEGMKTLLFLFAMLAPIPLFMIAGSLIHPARYAPGTVGELLYPIFGVPILIFNMWAWVHPEIIEFYFFGKENE